MHCSSNSWQNCNFPQEESSLYDELENANAQFYQNNNAPAKAEATDHPVYGPPMSHSVSPTQFYRNTSPSNEQTVNINQEFLPTSAASAGYFNNNNNNNNNANFNYQNKTAAMTLPRHNFYQANFNNAPGNVVRCVAYQPQNQQVFNPLRAAHAPYQHMQNYQAPRAMPMQPSYQVQQQQQLHNRPHLALPMAISTVAHAMPTPAAYHASIFQNSNMMTVSAPCQGNQPWTYAYCYGYASNNAEPCQYAQPMDIEDFMNHEKRKEKSRDAARCRRSRETEIFTELAQELPLKPEDVNQLDKASVMRIGIAYLKIRDMLHMFPKIQQLEQAADSSDDKKLAIDEKLQKYDLFKCADAYQLIKQTMDGFLLILSNEGDITYVSDSITEYLGISKLDILGQQIWEYTHQCDHSDLREALNIKRNGLPIVHDNKIKTEKSSSDEEEISTELRDLFVRFKCTLTSRGRSINIKSASYKVIRLTGHQVLNSDGASVLIAIGRSIPHPSNIEIPLCTNTFLTKHSLDMKFVYVDEKLCNLLGYESEDLLNKSLFKYHHGADSDSLMATFKSVLAKGQGETHRYRFLGKTGGYCWIVTQATIVYDKMKPQSIVCVNYVISNLEEENEIYSLEQYEASEKQKAKQNNFNDNSSVAESKPSLLKADKAKLVGKAAAVHNNNNNNNTVTIKSELNAAPAPPTKTSTSFILSQARNITATTTPLQPASLNTAASENLIIDQIAIATAATTAAATPAKHTPSKPTQTAALNEAARPKSVTASVLKAAPSAAAAASIPSTISLNALPAFNANSRAQSVTASVFTQLSSSSKQPQPGIKACSTATAAIFSQQTALAVKAEAATSHLLSSKPQQQQPPKATAAKSSLLAQDMHKGFLSFDEDADLTMLKQEPDDLAHLATNAVDACMPLDEATPLFSDMLGLMGPYSSLLSDDINSLDSAAEESTSNTNESAHSSSHNSRNLLATHSLNGSGSGSGSNNNTNSNNYGNNSGNNNVQSGTAMAVSNSNEISELVLSSSSASSPTSAASSPASCAATMSSNKTAAHIDPFINYREESNDTNCSQYLLSDSATSKSPEASSLPSLCSPHSLTQEDDFTYMLNVDLTMRAPYIPMNGHDDLPLWNSDVMMWNNANEDLLPKEAEALQQQQYDSLGYQQQQQHQHNFSNSLCSSPVSTASSLSPSPLSQQLQSMELQQQHHSHSQLQRQQQQQQHNQINSNAFTSDSSELAALLCGSGNGTLSILGNAHCNADSATSCHGGSSSSVLLTASNAGFANCDDNSCGSLSSLSGAGGGAADSQSSDVKHLQQLQQQLQTQHRHQQLLDDLNEIECKKQRFSSAMDEAPCFSDSMEDAFYDKDSTNLDCWNDFLDINVNATSSSATSVASPQQHLEEMQLQQDCKQQLQFCSQQQQQQQSIILNAMPLIAIQSNGNKNLLLQQQQQQQQLLDEQQQTVFEEQNLSNMSNNRKISTIKLMPISTTATIRVLDNKPHLKGNAATIILQQQQQGNKRHLNSLSQPTNKRLKSSNAVNVELPATPQLLQQLMAPLQQQQQEQHANKQRKSIAAVLQQQKWTAAQVASGDKLATTAAATGCDSANTQQQSNSVLKNLLISGCDVSAGYCITPLRPKKLAKA